MSGPVYCRAWSTNNEEKQDCLVSLTFKEELMVRDHHAFTPFANVSKGKISERKTDVTRDMDIRKTLCNSQEDFIPKK